MSGPAVPGFDPAAAFGSAAQQFLGLLQSLGAGVGASARAGKSGPGRGRAWDPVAVTAALATQFEQWLRATQFAGSGAALDVASASGTAGRNPAANAPQLAQWQRQTLELAELLQHITTLQARLSPYWSEIAAEAGRRHAAQLGAASRPPLSLQDALQMYERWVDCAEAAYAATVHRPEFCSLQAQLVNASAALLAWQRSHADALAQAFGLPTRSELDALQEQVLELQAAGQRRRRAAGPRGGDAKRKTAGKRARRHR